MRRFLTILIAAIVLVTSTGVAQALISPVKVLVEPAWQWLPFSDGEYLAYSTNSLSSPNAWNAKVMRLASGIAVRINAAGTEGFPGGFDPSSDKVIFQQMNQKRGVSDLYFWDLSSKTRSKVPDVNTASWEWDPRISSTWITFFREYKKDGVRYTGVYHVRRSNGAGVRVASFPSSNTYGTNGSVGDRYATWSYCDKHSCYAFVYDAERGKLSRLPTKNGRPQYAAAIDEDTGTVFFTRSGHGCGAEVFVYSVPVGDLGAAPTKIADLPDGIDIGSASLSPHEGGGLDYLFERIDCSKGIADVYALPSVTPASPV